MNDFFDVLRHRRDGIRIAEPVDSPSETHRAWRTTVKRLSALEGRRVEYFILAHR